MAVNELIILGLGWLLSKNLLQPGKTYEGPKAKGPPTSPSKVKWPGTEPEITYTPRASEAHAPEPGSGMPMMQKGIPGVKAMADRMIDQAEYGQGSGTGTRHYQYHRAKKATHEQVMKAKELLPGWAPGMRWRDSTDPSTMYVATKHGNKKAIEVYTSY
jgi:hypothetical protein